MKKVLTFLIAVVAITGFEKCFAAPEAFHSISLVALLSDPAKWNDVDIVTSGFLVHSNRGEMVFLSEGDSKNLLLENSVAAAISEKSSGLEAIIKKLSGEYVRLKGTFRAYDPKEVKRVPIKGCIVVMELIRPDGIFSTSTTSTDDSEEAVGKNR